MKKYLMLFCAVALAFTTLSCKENKKKEKIAPVFETDNCGVVTKINHDEKTVYLVFTAHYRAADSGRFENFDGITPVLNTLKEKNVKASFFPTGVCFLVDKYQQPIRRIIDEGHYLSAHSFNHLLLCEYDGEKKSLVTADSIRNDFAKMAEQLQRFGLKKEQFCWIIPPYEHYNQFAVDVMKSLGYKLLNPTRGFLTGMDWTSPDSKNYYSAKTILENLWQYEKQNGMNGVILLIHAMNYPDRTDDDRPYNHLGEIIDTLKSKGYGFKTMFDVIEAEK